MIKLTNLNGMLTSLINKVLGNSMFTFNVYITSLSDVVMEFYSENYRFIVSRRDNALRVYDNGNIYLIMDILPDNYIEEIDNILKQHAESLFNFYKLNYRREKFNRDNEANVYTFIKHDTI